MKFMRQSCYVYTLAKQGEKVSRLRVRDLDMMFLPFIMFKHFLHESLHGFIRLQFMVETQTIIKIHEIRYQLFMST